MNFFYDVFLPLCNKVDKSPSKVALEIGCTKAMVSNWKNRGTSPSDSTMQKIAEYFGIPVTELMNGNFDVPVVTEDTVSFQIMGDVAAGYDHVIYEDFTGGEIEIPRSYLKGRTEEEYFVLRVVGQSMYPDYQEGDAVLVHREDGIEPNGQVCVVLYDDENVTLKRVEYSREKNVMKLIPINPQFPPITIRDEKLDHVRILGVPKYMVREIDI